MTQAAWTVVIPVKRLAVAKTRLRGLVDAAGHTDLALALALDTVAAARLVAPVLVVTADPVVARAVRVLGPALLTDPGGGLNAALACGAEHAGGGRWRAALAADLPALAPAELTAALTAAERAAARCFVPDADGGGTVLLTAPPGVPLEPRFGDASAAAHAVSGAVRLSGDWPTLRRDVDTAVDVRAAVALGIGPHTTRALHEHGPLVETGSGAAGPPPTGGPDR